jgi:hypothetical protein
MVAGPAVGGGGGCERVRCRTQAERRRWRRGIAAGHDNGGTRETVETRDWRRRRWSEGGTASSYAALRGQRLRRGATTALISRGAHGSSDTPIAAFDLQRVPGTPTVSRVPGFRAAADHVAPRMCQLLPRSRPRRPPRLLLPPAWNLDASRPPRPPRRAARPLSFPCTTFACPRRVTGSVAPRPHSLQSTPLLLRRAFTGRR